MALSRGESAVDTQSVQRRQAHTAYKYKYLRESKNSCRRQGSEQLKPIKNIALILKPASTTPRYTVSQRSFHRDADKGIKVRRHSEAQKQRGSLVYRCATKAPHVTSNGAYGTCSAPSSWCIGLHMILCSKYNTATDRRCATSNVKSYFNSCTPIVKNCQH